MFRISQGSGQVKGQEMTVSRWGGRHLTQMKVYNIEGPLLGSVS